MIKLTDQKLPLMVQNLPQPPKQLFVRGGDLSELIKSPRLAIVGSRKVSQYGRSVTYKFASELAARGVIIVSGLALGVDSIAHDAALRAGGKTIAVLPAGLEKIVPTSHAHLAQQISQGNGLLVSEYPEGTNPLAINFVARNRIIASLAEGVLITEAAENSGSLHTARFAMELGLPVLAVPGPITSATSAGTNNLIKAGAIPVTSVEDILAALKWNLDHKSNEILHANTEPERIILNLINKGTSDGSELLVASNMQPAEFNQALTMLEITGRIRPLGANHWQIV